MCDLLIISDFVVLLFISETWIGFFNVPRVRLVFCAQALVISGLHVLLRAFLVWAFDLARWFCGAVGLRLANTNQNTSSLLVGLSPRRSLSAFSVCLSVRPSVCLCLFGVLACFLFCVYASLVSFLHFARVSCLPVCLSVCLSDTCTGGIVLNRAEFVCLSVCLVVRLPFCLSDCLSVCLPARVPVCVCVSVSICLPIYLFIYLPIYLSIHPSI